MRAFEVVEYGLELLSDARDGLSLLRSIAGSASMTNLDVTNLVGLAPGEDAAAVERPERTEELWSTANVRSALLVDILSASQRATL